MNQMALRALLAAALLVPAVAAAGPSRGSDDSAAGLAAVAAIFFQDEFGIVVCDEGDDLPIQVFCCVPAPSAAVRRAGCAPPTTAPDRQ